MGSLVTFQIGTSFLDRGQALRQRGYGFAQKHRAAVSPLEPDGTDGDPVRDPALEGTQRAAEGSSLPATVGATGGAGDDPVAGERAHLAPKQSGSGSGSALTRSGDDRPFVRPSPHPG